MLFDFDFDEFFDFDGFFVSPEQLQLLAEVLGPDDLLKGGEIFVEE